MSAPDAAQWHPPLRFAVGVTAAFMLCELLRWAPSFLAAVFTGALLANLPMRPPAKINIGLMLAIVAGAVVAFLISTWFRLMPTVMFGLVGLCMLAAFHKIFEGDGSPLPPLLVLICLATIPVITLVAPTHADVMPIAMVRAMAIALAIIALVWFLWPAMAPPTPKPPATPHDGSALRLALMATGVILPLMLVFLLFGLADVLPVMIGSVLIVSAADPRGSRTQASAMIVGNFGGGLLGSLMHAALVTTMSAWFLAALLFLATLGFGVRIAANPSKVPVLVIACNAMLIIFGSAIAEGPTSLALWLTRLLQFVLAGAFAAGGLALAWHLFPPPRAVERV